MRAAVATMRLALPGATALVRARGLYQVSKQASHGAAHSATIYLGAENFVPRLVEADARTFF